MGGWGRNSPQELEERCKSRMGRQNCNVTAQCVQITVRTAVLILLLLCLPPALCSVYNIQVSLQDANLIVCFSSKPLDSFSLCLEQNTESMHVPRHSAWPCSSLTGFILSYAPPSSLTRLPPSCLQSVLVLCLLPHFRKVTHASHLDNYTVFPSKFPSSSGKSLLTC